MLKAEMDEHLGYEKHAPESVQFDNSRNGKSRKTKIKIRYIRNWSSRDRHGTFEPVWYPNESEY